MIRGLNTFSSTCAMRYFKPLIINQVHKLTWLCFDSCFFLLRIGYEKIQASFLMHIKVRHYIDVTP
jgi:hypothetical protein